MQEAGLVPPGADVAGLLLDAWLAWQESRTDTPVDRAIAAIDAALYDAGTLGDQNAAGGPWQKDGVGYLPTNSIKSIIGDEIGAEIVMRRLKQAGRLICPARGLSFPCLPGSRESRLTIRHYRVRLQPVDA
jgi:hypothetical protein